MCRINNFRCRINTTFVSMKSTICHITIIRIQRILSLVTDLKHSKMILKFLKLLFIVLLLTILMRHSQAKSEDDKVLWVSTNTNKNRVFPYIFQIIEKLILLLSECSRTKMCRDFQVLHNLQRVNRKCEKVKPNGQNNFRWNHSTFWKLHFNLYIVRVYFCYLNWYLILLNDLFELKNK